MQKCDFLVKTSEENSCKCFISVFLDYVYATIHQTCEESTVPNCLKNAIKKEDGSERKADFSLFFDTPCMHHIKLHIEKIIDKFKKDSLNDFLNDCFIASNARLHFQLNRPLVFRWILRDVLTQKENYGLSKTKCKASVWLITHKTSSSLNNLRTDIIAEHVVSLLLGHGFSVYCDKNIAEKISVGTSTLDTLNYYDCTDQCRYEELQDSLFVKALNSEWKVDKNCDEPDFVMLDGKKYLKNKLNSHDYDKNIGFIYIKRKSITDCFRESAKLEHILQCHIKVLPDIILHIVSNNTGFHTQQIGLLLSMLSEKSLQQQFYLIHHQATCKNSSIVASNEYIQNKHESMELALVHKYGHEILTDKTWKTCIKTVSDTAVKFDFLLASFNVPLKLSIQDEKCKFQGKGGAFVLYNTARIAMLFKAFEEKVVSGYYEHLPRLEDVDFSVLKESDEWKLFFNYILEFPKLVSSVIESEEEKLCLKQIHIHKLCQMLISLSRDWSIYYSQSHILSEPFPQMFKKMTARLYLVQGIHQVFKNALRLINVVALDRM